MKLICPYCGQYAKYVDSEIIYGKSYGMVYLCEPCDAYVGVHRGTDRPKGSLAKEPLREARKAAHQMFDWYWKSGTLKRKECYRRLSILLGLEFSKTHIGSFDEKECEKVILACEYDLLGDPCVK
jgi:hypothetical protein